MDPVRVEHRAPRSSAGSTAGINACDPPNPSTSHRDVEAELAAILSDEADILQRDLMRWEEQISYAAKRIQNISQASSDNLGRNDEHDHAQCQSSPVSDEVLRAIQRLAVGISHDAGRLHTAGRAVAQTKDERGRRCRTSNRKVRFGSTVQGRAKKWKSEPCCSLCGCLETPQWRRGPKGPATLCNVCGLLYARRISRRRGSSGIVSFISS